MSAIPSPYDVAYERSRRLASFFDSEDILSRLHALQFLQHRSPYQHQKGSTNYWARISVALDSILPEHAEAAIALFSRVVYLDDALIESVTRQMIRDISIWCISQNIRPLEDTHIFCIDHPELIQRFFDFGADLGWVGRADQKLQINIPSASHLLQKLVDCSEPHGDTVEQVRSVFNKKVWIVITDNALGGGSAQSDLKRLRQLKSTFSRDQEPRIVFATQTYSEYASNKINAINADKIFHGLYFSDEWRLNSPRCKLFSPEMREKIAKLCHWFGTGCFGRLSDDHNKYPFINTLKKHQASAEYDPHFQWGWQDSAFTIITHKNSPTNSVPILWYPCTGEEIPPLDEVIPDGPDPLRTYRPPFPRNSSRKKQNVAGDGDRLAQIVGKRDGVRNILWGKA